MSAWRVAGGVLLGDVRRSPGAAGATVLAMAAGVAVFVAIYLAGAATESAFVSAVEAVAGKATHEVSAASSLDEERFPAFATHPAVEAAQPVIEGRVLAQDLPAPPLRVLGLDPLFAGPFLSLSREQPVVRAEDLRRFLTEPGAIVLPRAWATEAGIGPGDPLVVAAAGQRSTLRVLAVYELDALGEAARDTAVMDIAAAQELFGIPGGLTRIELVVKAGREDELRAALAPGERLERPASRGERVGRMIRAFRLNLMALGLLAVVVGALLVFNAAQFSVVRRGRLLGQLRCLGVTRRVLLAAVLSEVILFGLAGGAAGVALGSLLAQGLVGPMARTVTELYRFIRVDAAELSAWEAAWAIAGACAVAAAAGLFPALDAARTAPRLAGQRSRSELRFRAQMPRLIAFALAGLGLAALAVAAPAEGFWPGLVAAFALLGAGVTILPVAMAFALPWLQRAAERRGWLALALAAGAIHRSLSRAGGAAAALAAALGMAIGVVAMVYSFETEVRRWIGNAIRADIYVADAAEQVSRESARIPGQAAAILRAAPGVRAVDTLRAAEIPFGERSIRFVGVELPAEESRMRFEFLEGERDEAIDRALQGEVIVSEPLSRHHGLHAGDVLKLPAHEGTAAKTFRVAGVFRDYSYDRGYALTGKAPFIQAFGDPGLTNLAAYLEPGADPEAVAAHLRRAYAGRFALQVRSNADLRAGILDVFGRTFALTYLLQAIATLMALCGAAVTLFSLFLERAHEIATLRALGAEVLGIGRMFAAESLLLAFSACLMAVPLGAALAWVLIHVVNLRAFGWTIAYAWPWAQVGWTCLLALTAGLLATVVPLALARRQNIAAALREE